jgi:L-ascorbate metabolism protein UlaG (beta-lactamase superfamily)
MKFFRKLFTLLIVTIVALAIIIYLFMLQPSFGKLPAGERQKRIERSQHFKNGSFQNLETTRLLADNASYFTMVTKFFSTDTIREPATELPTIKTDLNNIDDDKPTIIWFGHSTYFISIGGKKILVDPVFSERASPVQYAGSKSYPGTMIYKPEDFPPLDLVIISHDHYDHLDYNTILKLKEKTKLFCVPLGIGEHLTRWDVDAKNIRNSIGGKVIQFYLRFSSRRHRLAIFREGVLAVQDTLGIFRLKLYGYSIFIGGDSGYDGSFKAIGEKHGPLTWRCWNVASTIYNGPTSI